MDEYDQYPEEGGDAEAPSQPDGAFARVNGGMLQSGKFSNQIVSLVGNITAHDAVRTADGSVVRIVADHLAESDSGSLIVDPNKAIEIMGQATGPTEITVRSCRGTVLSLCLCFSIFICVLCCNMVCMFGWRCCYTLLTEAICCVPQRIYRFFYMYVFPGLYLAGARPRHGSEPVQQADRDAEAGQICALFYSRTYGHGRPIRDNKKKRRKMPSHRKWWLGGTLDRSIDRQLARRGENGWQSSRDSIAMEIIAPG